MRSSQRADVAVATILMIFLASTVPLAASANCGDGMLEGPSEECDPGGQTYTNGDPTMGSCNSGDDCFFQFTCCKFNCQFVGTPGVACEDGNDCTGNDECNQVGTCLSGATVAEGAPCGDQSSGDCDLPDTCDAQGGCASNHVAAATPCGDQSDDECDAADTCDGAGTCIDNVAAAGTPAPTLCSDGQACTTDECDGTGGCLNQPIGDGEVCRGAAGACDVAEVCAGGACPPDTLVTAGTECRAAAGTCDVAEACDGVDAFCPNDAVLAAETVCRASLGECDLEEVCDGIAPACPGDAKRMDECRASIGQCDPAEFCDGISDACPADDVVPNGDPCDDQNLCTPSTTCQDGHCVGLPIVCSACEGCDPGTGTCVSAPLATCRPVTGKKARLIVKDKGNGRSVLVWKFNRLDDTTLVDFGDPTQIDPDQTVHFCLFDDASPMPAAQVEVPPGQMCGTRPCWRDLGVGFKYLEKQSGPSGKLLVNLREGGGGGKVNLKAKGALAPADFPLPFTGTVIAHMQARGACWQSTYSTSKRNTDTVFKALADD